MTDYFALNIKAFRDALDDHNGRCVVPATAFLLNPFDHRRIGVNSLWGLAVQADERVPAMRFRLLCDGCAWGIGDELETYILASRPARTRTPARTTA